MWTLVIRAFIEENGVGGRGSAAGPSRTGWPAGRQGRRDSQKSCSPWPFRQYRSACHPPPRGGQSWQAAGPAAPTGTDPKIRDGQAFSWRLEEGDGVGSLAGRSAAERKRRYSNGLGKRPVCHCCWRKWPSGRRPGSGAGRSPRAKSSLSTFTALLADVDADPRLVHIPLDRPILVPSFHLTRIRARHDRQSAATVLHLARPGTVVPLLPGDCDSRFRSSGPAVGYRLGSHPDPPGRILQPSSACTLAINKASGRRKSPRRTAFPGRPHRLGRPGKAVLRVSLFPPLA